MGDSKKKERSKLNKIIKGELEELKEFRQELSEKLLSLCYVEIDNHTKNSFAEAHIKPFVKKLEVLRHAYNSMLFTKTKDVRISNKDKQKAQQQCQVILNMSFETESMKTLQQYIKIMCANEQLKEAFQDKKLSPEQKNNAKITKQLNEKIKVLMPTVNPIDFTQDKHFDFTEARGCFLKYLHEQHLVKIGAELKEIMDLVLLELIAIYYTPSLYVHNTLNLDADANQYEKELDGLFKLLELYLGNFTLNFFQIADQKKKKSVVPTLTKHFTEIKKLTTEITTLSKNASTFLSSKYQEYREFQKTCRHRVLGTAAEGKYSVSSALIKACFHHEKDFNNDIFAATIKAKAKALYDEFVTPMKAYSNFAHFFGENEDIVNCFAAIQAIPDEIEAINNETDINEELQLKQKEEHSQKLHELYKKLLHLEKDCITKLKMAVIKKQSSCNSQATPKKQNHLMDSFAQLNMATSLAVSGEMRKYSQGDDDENAIYTKSYNSAKQATQKTFKQFRNFLDFYLMEQTKQNSKNSDMMSAENSTTSSSSGSETGILDTDSSSSSETETIFGTPFQDLPAAEAEAEPPRDARRTTLSPAQLARCQNGMWRYSVTPSNSKRPRSQSERQTGDAVGSPMAMTK